MATPPRPRTPNPEVDEVIQTGEIDAAPRSLIIRAGSSAPAMPSVEVHVDPAPSPSPSPSPSPPAPVIAAARPKYRWFAAALVCVAAAVAVMLLDSGGAASQTSQSPSPSLQAAAQFIGTSIDASTNAAMMRAQAIASSSMLRSAMDTDAKTISDMARDNDLMIPIKDGETVEIRGKKGELLLRLPSDAAPIAAEATGKAMVTATKTGLVAVAATPISNDRSPVAGEVTLAVPLDIAALRKRLPSDTLGVSLLGAGSPVQLVPAAGRGTKVTVPIETDSHAPLSLEATVANTGRSSARPLLGVVRFGGFALAGLFAAMFAVSVRRRA